MEMIKSEGQIIYATERRSCKSTVLANILNRFGEMKIYDKLLEEISKPEASLEYVHDLVECIYNGSDMFHFSFASTYLPKFAETVAKKILSSTAVQLREVF